MQVTPEMQYRYYDGVASQLTPQVAFFQSMVTERAAIIPMGVLRVASQCRAFATLEDHAGRLEALDSGARRSRGALLEDLGLAVENGLLLPWRLIQERSIIGPRGSAGRQAIDTIVIPTCNRPQFLARILSELTASLIAIQKLDPEIIVVDDSESGDMQAANRNGTAAAARSSKIHFRYGDVPTRERFAARLAAESGMNSDSIHFALGARHEWEAAIAVFLSWE
jgi:Glycosyl transferase family 2